MLPQADVSAGADFQRKYNAFYRVRQRSPEWYAAYYGILERGKSARASFASVLDEMRALTGRYEPSFCSKLVSTLDPHAPVWDTWVLKNTGHKAPAYASPSRFEDAKAAYDSIQRRHQGFLGSAAGVRCVNRFNEKVSGYYKMTDLKKVDFILWQSRGR